MAIVTGQGIDAHRFVEGRPLILGGVQIPHERGLAGHSDADVLTHAVCDALLGAIGAGDIGEHFPDSDLKYKDVSSLRLLQEVMDLVSRRPAKLIHVDATIIAQQPKIGPHKQAIAKSLASVLGDAGLNIKATTMEGMGFTGRGEGIAAMAVATVDDQAND